MAAATGVGLAGRGIVRVSGPQARDFLQNLVTCDLDRVDAAGAGHGALLTPLGKILFDFLIAPAGEDTYLLETDAGSLAGLVQRLTFYRLRAKVAIADASAEHSVHAVWDAPAEALAAALPAGSLVFADPRLAALGCRVWLRAAPETGGLAGLAGPEGLVAATEADWHARRVAFGVPEAPHDYAPGDVFPHDVDMDQLGGVAFDKGCFVGQEVVSRMQHRGTARRRIVQVTGAADLPAPGTPVTAAGKPAGTLGTVAGRDGLALLRLDRVASARAAGAPVEAAGVALEARLPDWAHFGWPEPAPASADDDA